MTTTRIGAAWAHGEPPPWMRPPPGFDEAEAADRRALLDERFGPLCRVMAERDRPPRPVPPPPPPSLDDSPPMCARRRDVLDRALHPDDYVAGHAPRPHYLPAVDHDRRAA